MRTGAVLATGAGLLALSLADTVYRLRDWGAADGEVSACLPGDDVLDGPLDSSTVVVGVRAPAEQVWRCLHEAAVAAAGTDQLRVGLVVPLRLAPRSGWSRLVRLDPGRCLVLRCDAGAVRSFHVVPTAPGRCRLLARTRVRRGGGADRVAAMALDPVAVLLTRRLLRRLAGRAELAERAASAERADVAEPAAAA